MFLLGVLALVRARQGRVAEAQQMRADLQKRGSRRYIPFLSLAYGAEACGDLDATYALLNQAIDEREPLAVITFTDRGADLLPRAMYHSLMGKMDLM